MNSETDNSSTTRTNAIIMSKNFLTKNYLLFARNEELEFTINKESLCLEFLPRSKRCFCRRLGLIMLRTVGGFYKGLSDLCLM